MTNLPTHKGALVVAHTTDHPTRRVFERDGADHMPWLDTAHLGFPSPLWYESSALLVPVPVPCDPETGKYLNYVPDNVTIPAGATYYLTTPTGLFSGPFDADWPYTPMMRFPTPHTFWTVEPIPEPEPEPEPIPEPKTVVPAGPSWWSDLTDDQRNRLEGLSGDQAKLVADLIQHEPGELTLVGGRGILPALRNLASSNTVGRRHGLVLALDAFLGGEL